MYQYQSICTMCTLTLLEGQFPFRRRLALHDCHHWPILQYVSIHPQLRINVTPHAQVMSTIMPRGAGHCQLMKVVHRVGMFFDEITHPS
jgi:hypothetical protein